MKALLITLAVALGFLATIPTAAQAQNGGKDQYGNRGVGDRASDDAVTASGTFSVVVTEETPEGEALAAEPSSDGSAPPEAPDEGDDAGVSGTDATKEPDLTELPDTGGAASLALGFLLVVGGFLVGRRILFR